MTRKDTERLVREQMQQTIPDRDALWAKIEQNLPAQVQTPAEKPRIRMHTLYRGMGAAACLLLVIGGVGVFSAMNHAKNYESAAPMYTNNADAVAPAEEAAESPREEFAEDNDVYDGADDAVSAEQDAPTKQELQQNGYTAGKSAGSPAASPDQSGGSMASPSASPSASPNADRELGDADYAESARIYLEETASELSLSTITNWDSPEIIVQDAPPEDYYAVREQFTAPIRIVRFTTTQDELLGTLDVYVDADGAVFGLGYRE